MSSQVISGSALSAAKPNRALQASAVLVLLLILAAVVRAVRIDREYMSGWLLDVAYLAVLVAVLAMLLLAAAKARTLSGHTVSLRGRAADPAGGPDRRSPDRPAAGACCTPRPKRCVREHLSQPSGPFERYAALA